MLVLSRKQGEQLQIGDDITITVLEVHHGRIRIGIDAPQDVRVLRRELCEWNGSNLPQRRERHAVSMAS